MSLFVIAECLAAPGQHDRLRTALEALIEPTLDEPGCPEPLTIRTLTEAPAA